MDLAELPTHRDTEQVLLRRARFPIGQQTQWDWVPLESKWGAVQETGLPGVHLQMCFLTRLSEAPCWCVGLPQLRAHPLLCSRPSPVLLSCGIPLEVARNALRLSVGRGTARADVDRAVQDLVQAVEQLERDPAP